MKVHIRTGLEVLKSQGHIFCKNIAVYEGDSESDETAKFLCQAFQDLEDGKIASVLITRRKEGTV
jgi:hypothetical protein